MNLNNKSIRVLSFSIQLLHQVMAFIVSSSFIDFERIVAKYYEKVLKEGRCNKHIGNTIDDVIQLLSNGTGDYPCQQIFQQVITKYPSFRSGIGFYTFIELCNKIFNINPGLLYGIIDNIFKRSGQEDGCLGKSNWPLHFEQLLVTPLAIGYNFRSDKIYYYIFHQTTLNAEEKIMWLEHYKISFPPTIFVNAITGISYDHDLKLFTWIMQKIETNDPDYINVNDYSNKNFYDWYIHSHGKILSHIETMMRYYENSRTHLESYKPVEAIANEVIVSMTELMEIAPIPIDVNRFSLLMDINDDGSYKIRYYNILLYNSCPNHQSHIGFTKLPRMPWIFPLVSSPKNQPTLLKV